MITKRTILFINMLLIVLGLFFVLGPQKIAACSTFKLQCGNELIYGHNLNNNGSDVPGLVFINKRGVFKTGRTMSELMDKEKTNPSALTWISRYGSVTFNAFGKDFPDGGMNEAGLYIWEMGLGNEEIVYPKNNALPKLNQMNWMQYILDNFATVDAAIQCAHDIEIDGWGWHFFVGDINGNCASIDFVDGKVVVHQGAAMPVPGLFNALYEREVELSRYFKGFGGLYEPTLKDPKVPRFVKTAVMLRDYKPTQNAVDYGFKILENIFVTEIADWSVIFDVRKQTVYFKTSLNPKIKHFAIDAFDFSNASPVLILNIDIKEAGDVSKKFSPFSFRQMAALLESLPLPKEFYEMGGLTKAEFVSRFSTHTAFAQERENQHFTGLWQVKPGNPGEKPKWEINLYTKGDAVFGEISNSKGYVDHTPIEHIHMIGNQLVFTFKSQEAKNIMEVKALVKPEKMDMELFGIEGHYGSFQLVRQPVNGQ
jgi:penicillin V acylase-like amidase (Ntn superfamily)